MIRALLLAAVVLGCSAPTLMPELAEAEAHEKAGRNQEALDAYARAAESCPKISDMRRRYATCRSAYMGRAELLDRMGKRYQAAELYEEIPAILTDHRSASAEALYRGGRIYLELGEDKLGYTLLWRTVTDYPNEEFAADALKIVVRDGRKRNARQLHGELSRVAKALSETAIADNLLYQMAELAQNELREPKLAISYYDVIADRYPEGGLVDDALWYGAKLSKESGDAPGALTRLKKLQSTREVAFGTGSYLSVWLDDGQLELGRLLRDDIGDFKAAAAAYRKLHELYPDSILRDDARMGEAISWSKLGEKDKGCAALAKLRKDYPESKYELKDAPALRTELGCAPTPQ